MNFSYIFQILTEILKQPSTSLRAARLVSTFWYDIVLSLPNTKLAFKLWDKYSEKDEKNDQDFAKDPFYFFEICSTLDKRLAKRITAFCYTATIDDTKSTPRIYSFGAKLMHICDKFSDIVQTLEITIFNEHCLKYIHHSLRNFCPNLKGLRIWCMSSNVEIPVAPILPDPLPTKSSLSLFTIGYHVPAEDRPFVTNFCQGVINASPNLKVVTLP